MQVLLKHVDFYLTENIILFDWLYDFLLNREYKHSSFHALEQTFTKCFMLATLSGTKPLSTVKETLLKFVLEFKK